MTRQSDLSVIARAAKQRHAQVPSDCQEGEGTFSEVLKAQNVKDSKYHAIKCMKNHFESIDQVNNLREIQALRRLSPHQHIVKLEEVLYDQPSGRLALVFELMDANLYEMIRGRRHYLKAELIQSLMYQLVKALDHMHNKGIFHRDIKPENILVDDHSKLKLADFGSCRGIYSKQPYTEYISTRWYRAPECLLTDGYYGPEMDMWGAGCVFFEITSLYPLFPGSNELDQIHRIHKILGTPTPEVLEIFKRRGAAHVDFNFPKDEGTTLGKLIPHASAAAIDLMYKMLAYDPSKRMNAREALRHEYFKDLREMEEAQARSQQQQSQVGAGGAAGGGLSPPPYTHQHISAAVQQQTISKGYKKQQLKDEQPESMGTSSLPLPSIHKTTKHSNDNELDDDDDDDDQDELPPIHGGVTKNKGAKASYKSQNRAPPPIQQPSYASSKTKQNTGMAVLIGHTNAGSSTQRSGTYQESNGLSTKSKKSGQSVLPGKKGQQSSKSKKQSSGMSSTSLGGVGTMLGGGYGLFSDKSRRK